MTTLPPPLRDAGPLETMARAIADGLEAFDLNVLPTIITDRLSEAGYAIVPVEPTAAMLASVDDEDSDKYVARGRAVSAWKAMIASHIEGGKAMSDQELIRVLLAIAGDEDLPEEYRGAVLAGLNRIEALRSRLSQFAQVDE